ncbi:EF hand family protein [Cryptosporidium muris RN66]|uniref:EF hand family protein n=1 Tax=Cryptosporidium muris (strain RN66) TaxID=441375 RepID=B6A9N1_CRYMR|nr:EF hand family protein [Cryptosporidium muris RN66]EEA04922.1 EF hand family protein [Cryptosporidium muris RN66]|eukprot:XP_002139271.1 EF hand family protein [Cryptosporidium muris RN66]
MLGNLPKPAQIGRKAIGIPSRPRTSVSPSDPSQIRGPLKRKPSTEYTSNINIISRSAVPTQSTAAKRPQPISRDVLEKARARRATLTPKTSNTKYDQPKEVPNTKLLTKDKVIIINDEIREKTEKKKIATSAAPQAELLNVRKELEELKKKYKEQNEILSKSEDLNKANLSAMAQLAALKAKELKQRRELESEKKFRKITHQNNIDHIKQLLTECHNRFEDGPQVSSLLGVSHVTSPKCQVEKSRILSIMDILSCEENFKPELVKQLECIEECNANIWGLGPRDLSELLDVATFFGGPQVNVDLIKTQVQSLNWYLSQTNYEEGMNIHIDKTVRDIMLTLESIPFNTISMEDLVTLLLVPLFSTSHYSYITQLFTLFDIDKDGYISTEDFRDLLKEIEWDGVFTNEEIDYLFSCVKRSSKQESQSRSNKLINETDFINFFSVILQY